MTTTANTEHDSMTDDDMVALLLREHDSAPQQCGSDSPGGPEKSPASYILNDLYHARKIVNHYGDNIYYCEELRGFHLWNEKAWRKDKTRCVWRWATDTSWSMYSDNDTPFNNSDQRTHYRNWALQSLRRRNIENAIKHLQAQPEIVATPDMFDRDPWLFNVNNGTIDLKNGTLREHRREDMITKLSPVQFDPAAAPPKRWLQFLEEIFEGNKSLIDFVQRACGYALTGVVSEQKLFFLYGSDSNGKSTFLATLTHVMGEYAMKLEPGALFTACRNTHPAGYADLKGTRFAVVPETEYGRRLSEVAVKELTGTDPLTTRRMRQNSFEFNPTHTLFMCGNHLPIIRGNEHASWRRILLIPFGVTIAEEEQDKDLSAKLRAEASGILNWLVEGCLEWQKKGLAEPAEVAAATGAYRSDMDVIEDFLDECCTSDPDGEVTNPEMRKAYETWCQFNGERPMSATALTLRLKEKGLVQKRKGHAKIRTWLGIEIETPEEPLSEEELRRFDKLAKEMLGPDYDLESES